MCQGLVTVTERCWVNAVAGIATQDPLLCPSSACVRRPSFFLLFQGSAHSDPSEAVCPSHHWLYKAARVLAVWLKSSSCIHAQSTSVPAGVSGSESSFPSGMSAMSSSPHNWECVLMTSLFLFYLTDSPSLIFISLQPSELLLCPALSLLFLCLITASCFLSVTETSDCVQSLPAGWISVWFEFESERNCE